MTTNEMKLPTKQTTDLDTNDTVIETFFKLENANLTESSNTDSDNDTNNHNDTDNDNDTNNDNDIDNHNDNDNDNDTNNNNYIDIDKASSKLNETISIISNSINHFENNLNTFSHTEEMIKPIVDKTIKTYREDLDDGNSVFHNIKDSFRGMDLDLSNIMLYAARTMEMVEVFNSGSGFEKKELVVSTIMKLVDDNPNILEEDKEFIEFMLDGLVETILKTSKKEIKLTTKNNKGKTKVKGKQKKVEGKLKLSFGQIVDSLVDKCTTIIKTNRYKAENIIINIPIMAGMVMSIVETYDYLSGTEKKNVVIKVIQKLIADKIPNLVELNDSHTRKLQLVSQIIPSVIDILVEIANGKYKINELIGGLKKICKCCCK